ncbi:MAG: hypothetical protein D6706_05680 [Chloroflexi bacterium]|nr:MAG: hypothetical protein D6706_05680 [Chloroflexota bacterium]
MNRNTSPGLGQWITVSIMVVATLFLLIKLYQYAGFRRYYPAGLTIGGVNVGGLTREEASELLNNVYLNSPIIIYHGEQPFEVSPTEAKFTLDLETMLAQADFQRAQQDFWAGFWGFLWGRPVEVDPVPLSATHDREELRSVLQDIALLMDQPPQPPQPVPTSLSFQYGEPGIQTNIEASFADVEAALYRPSNREARLIIEPVEPARPNINLLARLLVNHLQPFEQRTGGVASVFIMDLDTGEEVAINADVAMSGMDLLRIPIVLETYRVLDGLPNLTQRALISDTLVIQPDVQSANALLNIIAGEEDPYRGVDQVTDSMQKLGLVNTFILAPYGETSRPGVRTLETPANSVEGLRTSPDPLRQTTAEDIGTLLSMIYYCAQGQGGALMAVYGDDITRQDCQEILNYMSQNKIGSLLEEGVPPNVTLAHRHGWIGDTHGDAGIVFTPGGNYVIVEFLYKPEWLEWELSAPLLADVSRATYNYFNFDTPYLTDSRAN